MTATLTVPAAHAEAWKGSYVADGVCYCSQSLPNSLGSRIVPTPVGGLSVSQVCDRIGDGPELIETAGLFNYPVYADAQCGNGPQLPDSDYKTADCAGSLAPGAGDCQPTGPRWDLEAAFDDNADEARLAASPAGEPEVATRTIESSDGRSLRATVVTSAATSRQQQAAKQNTAPVADTVSDDTSGATLVSQAPAVLIDGQTFRQAPAGISADGGAPGSRIILDNKVYLLDDGTLAPLYLQAAAATPKPRAAVAEKNDRQTARRTPDASDTASTGKQKTASTAAPERSEESVKIHRERLLAEARERALQREAAAARATARTESRAPVRAPGSAGSAPVPSEPLKAESGDVRGSDLPAGSAVDADESRLASQPASEPEANDNAAAVAAVTDELSADTDASTASPVISALRLPPDTRASSRDFGYIEAMPVSYDFGGGGVQVEGSASSHGRVHYLGRLGVANEYLEVMLGGGMYLTPPEADRFTLVLIAGVEAGSFELRYEDSRLPDIQTTDYDDAGIHLGLNSRMVVNNRFELEAGVGYSTFFEGDAVVRGGGFFHINKQLDLISRFEVGDNDSLGIGVRFYY